VGAVARLDALRLAAVEAKVDADLAVGRHLTAVSELEVLVEAHPMRERLWAQLMLALYRSGRQVDALRTLERVRRLLAEAGVGPAPELVGLQSEILAQAPGLLVAGDGGRAPAGPQTPAPAAPRRRGPASPLTAKADTPLIGRAREQAALVDAVTAAARGQ